MSAALDVALPHLLVVEIADAWLVKHLVPVGTHVMITGVLGCSHCLTFLAYSAEINAEVITFLLAFGHG